MNPEHKPLNASLMLFIIASMPEFTNVRIKKFSVTKRILNQYPWSAYKDVLSKITSKSIHPVTLALKTFSFLGINFSVDINSLVDFDLMHLLSLGIRKILESVSMQCLRSQK